jgi:hypothetical protein
MITITELLQLKGFDLRAKTKIVRHQGGHLDLWSVYRRGHLEVYQAYQAKPVFNCDYVVSFIGLDRARARLTGVYKVLGSQPAEQVPLTPGAEYLGTPGPGSLYYHLQREHAFDGLADRVVIDWGAAALTWHQWLVPKEVVEILPAGFVRPFPGYLDFALPFAELRSIIESPEPNREWHRALSSVAGVYLILDMVDGRQYVGSAYGAGGILARWRMYAETKHGGNARLVDLLKKDPYRAEKFQFTVLRTLPTTLTVREVIEFERLYKQKLGSRAFGLNIN